MTILEAIESASKSTDGIRKIIFADIREVNSFVDSFEFLDWPIHIIEPFETNVTFAGPRAKTKIQLHGWIMRRMDEDTNDFRSRDVEDKFLAPMRNLAIAYLKKLIQTDANQIIDREEAIPSINIKPEYMFTAQHAIGVSYQVILPVTESIC